MNSEPNLSISSLKKKVLQLSFDTGLARLGQQFWAKSLTVLNYHRVDDPDRQGFESFKPNISARREDFDRQMEYLARWFNVVAMRDVVNWLEGHQTLPPYAALITFDDGYLDNYINAYPILRKYNFPATIFLTTNHIGNDIPFYWDLAAYCFSRTTNVRVSFPDGKVHSWSNSIQRDLICKSWVEAIKIVPGNQQQEQVSRLKDQLNVSVPDNFFRDLMMSWSQIRDMHRNGIDFGGHTLNHPILSRISLEEAKKEIEGSKAHIEQELGESIFSFAYPNGMMTDFTSELKSAVHAAGYKAAFTLLNGPSTLHEVIHDRFAIRRIFISRKNSLPQFSFLVSRLNRYRG